MVDRNHRYGCKQVSENPRVTMDADEEFLMSGPLLLQLNKKLTSISEKIGGLKGAILALDDKLEGQI